jgi:tetratricopeptide (TPR) repeat protein
MEVACPLCSVEPEDCVDAQYDAAVRMRVRAHMAIDEETRKGLHVNADTMLRGALKAGPDHANAHNHLGNTLLTEAKDIEGAIAAFKKAIAVDPQHALAHYNLGGALYKKGQTEAAIERLKKSTTLNPKFAVAHHDLGTALYNKEKIDGAIAQYKRVLVINPQSVAAYFSLGKAFRRKGAKWSAQAEDAFGKARAINPEFGKKQPPPFKFWNKHPEIRALQVFLIVLAIGLFIALAVKTGELFLSVVEDPQPATSATDESANEL